MTYPSDMLLKQNTQLQVNDLDVVVGINAVAAAMKSRRTKLAVVCASVQPSVLTEHLYIQAQRSQVHLCIPSCSSAELGRVLGCRLVVALAVGNKMDTAILDRLRPFSIVPNMPWLANVDAKSAQLLPMQIEEQKPNPNRD